MKNKTDCNCECCVKFSALPPKKRKCACSGLNVGFVQYVQTSFEALLLGGFLDAVTPWQIWEQ